LIPVSSYWQDEQEPLPVLLPKEVKQKEKELIELPQADTKPMQMPLKRKIEIEEL